MYHYVRNMHETEYREIKGLLIDKFKQQLDYLMKNYKIIKFEDYIGFLNGKKDIPDNAAILAFDDGLKDHYTNVFPILKEKNVPACFFPITGPLVNFKVQPVQKVHFLLAKAGTQEIVEEFNNALKEKFPSLYDKYNVTDREIPENKKRWGDRLTRNLKYTIGILDSKTKNVILDVIFCKFFDDEKEFCKELYMGWDEMKEMIKEGMSFGGHSHTHPMLSELGEKEQLFELQHSKEILERNLNTEITLLSYPYGNFNKTTLQLLKQVGYACALTATASIQSVFISRKYIEQSAATLYESIAARP